MLVRTTVGHLPIRVWRVCRTVESAFYERGIDEPYGTIALAVFERRWLEAAVATEKLCCRFCEKDPGLMRFAGKHGLAVIAGM